MNPAENKNATTNANANSNADKIAIEIQSLKLAVVFIGALIALAILAVHAAPAWAPFLMFVAGMSLVLAAFGMLIVYYKKP